MRKVMIPTLITCGVILGFLLFGIIFLKRELPKGHKACINSCTLDKYTVENPFIFGYECEELIEKTPSFCTQNK